MGLSDEIKKINAEIDKLRKELGSKPLKPFKEEDIDAAKLALQGLRSEVREMGSDLDYVSKSFKDSVNELSRQNSYLIDARKSLSSISDISRKIVDYRKGDSTLTEKQLKNLQQQAKTKFDSLKNDLRSGQLSKANAEEVKNALDQQQKFDEEVQRTIDHQKAVNKEIGLLGTGLSGAAKILSKMGFGDLSQPLQDAIDKTKNARLQQKLNNDELSSTQSQIDEIVKKEGLVLSKKQMQAGFGGKELKDLANKKQSLVSQNKELGKQTSKYKNIGKSLLSQITSFNLIDFVIGSIVKAVIQADKETGDLAKNMNMTYSEANQTRQELTGIATSSGDVALNTSNLQNTLVAVGQSLGTNAQLNEKDLKTMTKLVHQAGFQHDELMNIQKLSLTNGKTLEDNTKEILGGAKAYASKNKLVINEKEVLKEVNNSSKALQLSLGQSTKALAESVVKAKQFGLNLEQAESIASSMLDFESSIENELSAELLTGKNLNMEKARQLALEGDIAGAAAEVAKQVGGTAEFSKMNVLQQDALAKSMGLQREELAASLIEREALQKIGAKDAEEARKKYDALVQQYGVEEAQKRLGDEQLANQFQQQSVQERMGDLTSKLQEIFVAMAPALLTIGDLLMNVFTIVGYILKPIQWIFDAFNWIGESINKIIGGSKIMAYIFKGLVIGAGLLAAYMAWASLSAIPVVGAVLGGVVAGSIIAASFAAAGKIKANDMLSPGEGSSGYGKRTLFGPEGAIQLNNKDTVIAGTNLFGDDVKSEPGKPTERAGKGEIKVKSEGGGKVDMTQTNALLQQLINVIQSGGTVTLDGQKVGEALKLGSFQTQ